MSDSGSIPASIGRYVVHGELGRGAMGVVYRAHDPSLGRAVAIKTLDRRRLSDPTGADRFVREARAVARLSHPHIVAVYDVGTEGDLAYMVMELVRGHSVQERLAAGRAWPIAAVVPLAEQLLDALAYVHTSGVVHRDIKPANVMLDDAGRVKLADFGVARVDDAAERTQAGTVIGTPRYMAPEQLEGRMVGPRADLFSVGALLYRLLTGHDAFEGRNVFEVMQAVMRARPPAPSSRPGAMLPVALDAVLLKALEGEPAARYGSAAEMALALRQVLPDGAPPELPPPPLLVAAAATGEAGGPPDTAESTFLAPLVVAPATPAPSPEVGDELVSGRPGLPAEAGEGFFSLESGVPPGPASDRPRPDGDAAPVADTPPPPSRADAAPDGTLFLAPGGGSGAAGPRVHLVVTASADARLVGRTLLLTGAEVVIGRDAGCELRLDDHSCSRRHALLRRAGARWTVQDLGSTNGTLLDGRRLAPSEPQALRLGATLRIGDTALAFAPADDTMLPDLGGALVAGRYRVEAVLRASPKATVYLARSGDAGPRVALKLMSPAVAGDADQRLRLARAAEAASRLQHPHVCPLVDHGMADITVYGRTLLTPYLCHALLSGGSLAQRLAAGEAPPTTADIVRWLGQIGSALAHAHRRGVVHGDLKPTSIAFDEEGNAYLMDFGMAASEAEQAGPLFGSPAYMAPELWDGAAPDAASDQFALAVLAYTLFTGTRPFSGHEDPRLRERGFRRGAPPAHEEARLAGRDDLPRTLSPVLQRAMAPRREDRFESVSAFIDALHQSLRRGGRSGESPTVFVSYQHHASAGWAVLLARDLKERHKISAFVDTQRLDAAVQFPDKLARAIERCDVFVCLLAEGTLSSRWVLEEIRLAHRHRKPMVPVFQESFSAVDPSAFDEAVRSLLQFDGVHLLDRRNIHVDHTIDDLARLVLGTLHTGSG